MMKVPVPTHWQNLAAYFPALAEVEGGGGAAGTETRHLPKMPLSIARQSLDRENRFVEIPAPVAEIYAAYRPTPLRRAERWERRLGTSCRIYFKYEGANISGSHKLNTAIAQAYYYKQAGVSHVVTGTGAGQWGTALAYACAQFGLRCTVFMPRVSLAQKPGRRALVELFGARLVESPSAHTVLGKRVLAESPGALGSLAVATGEALELALGERGCQFAVGSGDNHVLLHQTVIGLEARRQLEALEDWPDAIYACMGAGSNFAGISFPFLAPGDAHTPPRCVAVEPIACPKLTRGIYATAATDFSGLTPFAKMMTLGADFEAPGIHAGGLRYHGTSPFLSAMYRKGLFFAEAHGQLSAFAAAEEFALAEGILPAPESAYALCAVAAEAKRRSGAGAARAILVNISGSGAQDLTGYDEYRRHALLDDAPDEALLARSLERLREAERGSAE